MKHRLGWQPVTHEELADHLKSADILTAEAIGGTSVYRCRHANGETIAISLPGEIGPGGLIVRIEFDRPSTLERRRNTGKDPLDE